MGWYWLFESRIKTFILSLKLRKTSFPASSEHIETLVLRLPSVAGKHNSMTLAVKIVSREQAPTLMGSC